MHKAQFVQGITSIFLLCTKLFVSARGDSIDCELMSCCLSLLLTYLLTDVSRNNLTVLDGIVVQGQGARGEFTLNGKRPGSQSTLLFEIKPSQLTDCHSKSLFIVNTSTGSFACVVVSSMSFQKA